MPPRAVTRPCLLLLSPDEEQSSCHGSVLQGLFQGSIATANGTYHVEPLHSYTDEDLEFHSIIYHEDDIGKWRETHGTLPSSFLRAPVFVALSSHLLACEW